MALTRLRSAEAAARWLAEWVSGELRTDSRLVQRGDAFIAWPGYATDGRQYVRAALDAGAATCLVEDAGIDAFGFETPGHAGFIHGNARIATLPALKAATGPIAAAYFGRPAEQLSVIAVTGTNGKSSTAWWTAQALTLLGRRCGVIGTLGIGEPPAAATGAAPPASGTGESLSVALSTLADDAAAVGRIRHTGLTTPDPVQLHAALREMVDADFAACAIEASSIGIVEQRLAGLAIEVAQFTNLTRDHLDYHGDMATYGAAKRLLFDWPGLRAAVINIDDAEGAALADALAGRSRHGVPDAGAPAHDTALGPGARAQDSARDPHAPAQGSALDLWTTSVGGAARLSAQALRYTDAGLAFDLVEGAERLPVRSALIGDYNAANLLAVLGALRALGVPLALAARTVPGLTPVPGRMQRVAASVAASGQPEVVVDYAHTPDALEKALGALRALTRTRGGQLWCVFGCGGNRDATKRPLMGAIAQRLADRVIVTSDNPRDEAPAAILAQIVAGIDRSGAAAAAGAGGVEVIEDRRAAIEQALAQATARDVVLLAGKGHEDYQEIAGVRRPFSDLQVATEALRARGGQ